MEAIKRETEKLKKTLDSMPRTWKFRGRRIVPAENWKYGDWSKFPDRYHLLAVMGNDVPADWRADYFALLRKIKDPEYAKDRCYHCAVNQAQHCRKELDRHQKYWAENGGEEAKQRFYEQCGEPKKSQFRREDAMLETEWRLYNELAGANNRTCKIINYFHCPYGDEWRDLIEDGYLAYKLWQHVTWYDRHWNPDHTFTSPASERKWYHYGEPAIIDVTNLDDICKALDDGRFDKIVAEHERYMKETGYDIWAI